jgi:hypothetical protein
MRLLLQRAGVGRLVDPPTGGWHRAGMSHINTRVQGPDLNVPRRSAHEPRARLEESATKQAPD